jgi:hypothetical protein
MRPSLADSFTTNRCGERDNRGEPRGCLFIAFTVHLPRAYESYVLSLSITLSVLVFRHLIPLDSLFLSSSLLIPRDSLFVRFFLSVRSHTSWAGRCDLDRTASTSKGYVSLFILTLDLVLRTPSSVKDINARRPIIVSQSQRVPR